MSKSSDVPYGYCHCGCGQKTSVPSVNNAFFGYKKGQPLDFVHGHNRHPVTPKDKIPPDPNPSGLCMCGCGKKTKVVKITQAYRGRFAGHHFQFYHGHNRRKVKIIPSDKLCHNCNTIKDRELFYSDKRRSDGLSSCCKDCTKKSNNKNYHDNPIPRREKCRQWRNEKLTHERHKEYQERWKSKDIAHFRFLNRKKENKRRAIKLNLPAEDIDPLVVYKSHDGICGLCHKPVSIKNFHVDHVIPLSQGGHHIYSNVQPAHPHCNLKKHNKIDFELSSI